MQSQFSKDNSPVELELLSGHLLFCDPLYFQSIIEGYHHLGISATANPKEIIKNSEEKLFPFGGGWLLGYKYIDPKLKIYRFDPYCLKRWDTTGKDQNLLAQKKEITTFGLDTTSFLIIDFQNIAKLVEAISYDSLIDALLANELDNFIQKVNIQIGNKAWAYVVGEANEKSGAFDGDGFYYLE
jgi:hypothetical protein